MRTWTGRPLAELLPALEQELEPYAGATVVRVLPSRARVALLRRSDGGLQLWLWRVDPPVSLDWRTRWQREVDTFLRHFGCEQWTRITDPPDPPRYPVWAAFDAPVTP